MRRRNTRARLNRKVIALTVGMLAVAAGAVFAAHKIRNRTIISRSLSEGAAALAQHDWKEAVKHLRLYLSKQPDDVEVLKQFGEANLAIRPMDVDALMLAMRAYRGVLRVEPGERVASHQLGHVLYKIEDFNEAAHVYRQRLEVDPSDPVAMLGLGRSLLAMQERTRAKEILERLVDKHPDQIKGYGLLSAMAMDQEESDDAMANALHWVDAAVEAAPESAEALVQRARFLRAIKRDADAARRDLEAAEALDSVDPSVNIVMAGEWIALGELDAATAAFHRVADTNAETLRAFDIDRDDFQYSKYYTAAQLALAGSDAEAAAQTAEDGLNKLYGPGREKFLPMAVKLYLSAGQTARARQTVDEYRQVALQAAGGSARLNEDLEMADAAVADAEGRPYVVIKKLSDVVGANEQQAEAWRLLSLAYEQTGQPTLATQALREYVHLTPRDFAMALKLARELRSHNLSEAIAYARHARNLRSDHSEVRLLMANLQLDALEAGAGDRAEIPAVREELEALQPDVPGEEWQLVMARVAALENRSEDAVECLKRAGGDGSSLHATTKLIRHYRRAGQTGRALEACEQLVTGWPHLAFPRILQAELELEEENRDLAQQILETAVAELEGAEQLTGKAALVQFLLTHGGRERGIAMLREMAASHPQSAKLRMALLSLPETFDDPSMPEQLIGELRAIEGESGLWWRVAQARAWMQQADWQDHRHEIEDTLKHCIQANSNWDAPVLALGELYERLGQHTDAETLYRDAFESASLSIDLAARWLELMIDRGRFTEANDVLKKLPPHLPQLRPQRIQVAVALERYDAAVAELEAQLQDDPHDPDVRGLLGRILYRRDRDSQGALAVLEEGPQPDEIPVLAARAFILHAEERDDEALSMLDGAVERRDDAPSRRLRASFLETIGRIDAAEQAYRKLASTAGAEGLAALAAFYERQHRLDDAISAWEAAVEQGENTVHARRSLALALARDSHLDRKQRAKTLIDDLLSVLPDDLDLVLLRAELDLSGASVSARDAGKARLAELIGRRPDFVPAQSRWIELAVEEGRLEEADERVVQALGAPPHHPDLLLAQARIEHEQGNTTTAAQLAESLRDEHPDAVEVHNFLAEVALERGSLDEAAAHSERALNIAPNNIRARQRHADVLAARGEWQAAISSMQAAGAENVPDTAETFLALAELHRRRGAFQQADEQIRAAQRRSPGTTDALVERVRWFAAQDKLGELVDMLAELDVHDPRTHAAVVISAMEMAPGVDEDHMQAVLGRLHELLELAPSRVDARLAQARLAFRLGDTAAAESAYRQVLNSEPYQRDALNDLAQLLLAAGRGQEALPYAEAGVMRYPDDPALLHTRGVTYQRLGRLDEARRDFGASLAAADDSPGIRSRALLHLAEVQLEAGDTDAARSSLEEARQIDRAHEVLTSQERNDATKLTVALQ